MVNCKSMLFLIRCIATSIRKISSLKLFSPCTTIQRLLCYNTRRLGKSQYRAAISVIRLRSINLRSSKIAQIGEIGEIGAQSDTVKIELFRFCTFFRLRFLVVSDAASTEVSSMQVSYSFLFRRVLIPLRWTNFPIFSAEM